LNIIFLRKHSTQMDFQQAYTALDTLIKTELGTPNANTRGSNYIKTLKTHFLKSGVYTKNRHAQSLSPDLYLQACKKIFHQPPLVTFHENCVFFCAHYQEFQEFQRHYQRLQYFYSDLSLSSQSTNYDHIQGIYLTYLLSEGKHDDFHLTLESLPIEKHSNPYYQFAIMFERDLMVGNFKTG
jgi:hypothetical protein